MAVCFFFLGGGGGGGFWSSEMLSVLPKFTHLPFI